MQLTNIFGSEVGLKDGETTRLHMTKEGKVLVMPYPMSVSFSHVGLHLATTAKEVTTQSLIDDKDLRDTFLALLESA